MQQHSFSTDEWISLRNSPFLCGRKYMAPLGLGFGEHLNIQPHHAHGKCFTIWSFNYQDQMLSTSCFKYWLWWKRYRLFIYGVIFKMISVHWQQHFIFDRWMDVLREIVSFLWHKMSHSRGVSTQNLSIHAECSAIWNGFWHVLVPYGLKRVQNTMSQKDWICDLVISCL